MISLRARLLASLLALTALGLLALGGITYAEQRSFLYDRVDQQVRAAGPLVHRVLHGFGRDDGRLRPGRRGPGRAGGPGGDGGGPPAGTYVARLDASGEVLHEQVLRLDRSSDVLRPELPHDPPLGRIVTVGGTGTDYRLLATPDRLGGGISVVAVPLAEADQTLERLLLVEALVIAAVLLVLGAVAWAVVRVGLLPLDRMGRTAGAIAGGDLSHRVEATDPRTEVGRLGMALNSMLDRLEEAFAERQASEDRLRRFLADASHELRTPLASIRGYAELFRIGALTGDAERGRALRRIEDEAARMGVLVEDLLTLARLDQVAGAPHVPVDLGPLVRDAVSDARATAPDRAVKARIEGAVTVCGDADQLRQVLANLVRNALTHTPAGTPVEASVQRAGATVRLQVRDHGPGLPTDRPQELFERFWRSEGGRARGRAGAGLGLAIVAAIVEAHRGQVAAADAPGGGAAFSVTLPAA